MIEKKIEYLHIRSLKWWKEQVHLIYTILEVISHKVKKQLIIVAWILFV